jgi:hypothetical protein
MSDRCDKRSRFVEHLTKHNFLGNTPGALNFSIVSKLRFSAGNQMKAYTLAGC